MNRKTGYIDSVVGSLLRSEYEVRPSEVEKAAASAGLSTEDLRQVMSGERRLNAGELFIFSRVLSVPVSVFFEKAMSRCTL